MLKILKWHHFHEGKTTKKKKEEKDIISTDYGSLGIESKQEAWAL